MKQRDIAAAASVEVCDKPGTTLVKAYRET